MTQCFLVNNNVLNNLTVGVGSLSPIVYWFCVPHGATDIDAGLPHYTQCILEACFAQIDPGPGRIPNNVVTLISCRGCYGRPRYSPTPCPDLRKTTLYHQVRIQNYYVSSFIRYANGHIRMFCDHEYTLIGLFTNVIKCCECVVNRSCFKIWVGRDVLVV